MDALEEMKKALVKRAAHKEAKLAPAIADRELRLRVLAYIPAIIAELEARRAAMGEDITTREGF
jgi:hypothetical protein